VETKVCTKCDEEKPATTEYFVKGERYLHGVSSRCKSCDKIYREQNKERISEKQKQWFQENNHRATENMKGRYQENKDAYKANAKLYRQQLPAGVYRIRNKETGRVYIGASTATPKRWARHKRELRKRAHHNIDMQRDYDSYGLDSFEFEIIEEFPCNAQFSTLEKKEAQEIKTRLTEGQNLYNIPHEDRKWEA